MHGHVMVIFGAFQCLPLISSPYFLPSCCLAKSLNQFESLARSLAIDAIGWFSDYFRLYTICVILTFLARGSTWSTCLNAQNVFESIWKAISVCLVRGFFCHNVQGRLLPSLECTNYRGTIYDRMQRDITRWWCQARTMQWLNMQKVRARLEPND